MFERFLDQPGVGRDLLDIGQDLAANILRLIGAGWERRTPDCGADSGEVQMTKCLREGMIGALKDHVIPSAKKLSVLPGTESWQTKNPRRPAGLTDISIHLSNIREKLDDHGPHAIIECKRVAGDNAGLCRQYVIQGIDRFKEGKYAEGHAIAFMVGYLLSPSVEAAVSRINRFLSTAGREEDRLNPCAVLNKPWTRSSHRSRTTTRKPIDLHHAFLRFAQ